MQPFISDCSLEFKQILFIAGSMKIKSLILVTGFLAFANPGFSQTVVVTDDSGYTTGHASSVLDVKSTSKGLLIPRVTLAQRNSISSPATGLMVFQTDNTPGFYYYNGSSWTSVGPTVDGSETKLSQGTNITITGSGTTGSPYTISSSGGGISSYTQAQRNSLSPTSGLVIWCSNCGTAGELQVYNGSSWTNVMGGTAAPILPTLTTSNSSAVLSATATSGGNISSDGGGNITARGVCWSTSQNPTIALSTKTNEGSGTTPNPFTSYITGLSPSTTYYIRAYATNAAGTAYGDQKTITTIPYALGHPAFGGVIAYLSSATHGFVVSTYDVSVGSPWGCMGSNTGATGSSIGSGYNNTDIIINSACGYDAAAWDCYNLWDGDGYPFWHLPSSGELTRIYNNRASIGISFSAGYYWSSTEVSSNQAYARRLDMITTQNTNKDQYLLVRAIRNF
jgi:hypothetical protein